ncbi:hypothetical protein N7455_010495 [Penicillium solitum]|uniref:uncharacterized protein n=1 Tax=Penicillium solitum TaxID=60172 RepID=UPI0017F087D8|nr:hypothetical protein HAV15_000421 [Penicillium sp. str. \
MERLYTASELSMSHYSDGHDLLVTISSKVPSMRIAVDEAPDEFLNSFLDKVTELMTNNMADLSAAMNFITSLPRTNHNVTFSICTSRRRTFFVLCCLEIILVITVCQVDCMPFTFSGLACQVAQY